MKSDSILKNLLSFSVPYLVASFLQTFYGLADLFITGQYNGAASITAVSVGSQVTHFLTVVIVGLAMGVTVLVSRSIGSKDFRRAASAIGSGVWIFVGLAAVLTVALLLLTEPILAVLRTPAEAWGQTKDYLWICFCGVPFIVAYNALSSVFRGLGDTVRPMYCVAAAGIVNIVLDYILIGRYEMGAQGAALGTIAAQAFSVVLSFVVLVRRDYGITFSKEALRPSRDAFGKIFAVGLPIAVQDGCIQVAFLSITAIANARGVDTAAAVGIVEKLIGFFFLVPSAFGSATSALVARYLGAGEEESGRVNLRLAMRICVVYGAVLTVICWLVPAQIVGLFAGGEMAVIILGAEYLRAYIFDCMIAGVHFCFSGYFTAYGRSWISFLHNIISIVLVRIPGAYLASVYFPETLFPMGLAAPVGSLLSAGICVVAYRILFTNSTMKK